MAADSGKYAGAIDTVKNWRRTGFLRLNPPFELCIMDEKKWTKEEIHMKKPNVLIGLLQLIGAIILGWILWLFIFAAIIPEEQDISNFQSGISILLGAVTGILVLMIIKYNGAHRTQQTARKAFSDIKVYEEKTDRLLGKANRVSDKYMKHEKKVYTQIEEARSQGKGMVVKIRNGSEFQQAIEKFPELRSNENRLLRAGLRPIGAVCSIGTLRLLRGACRGTVKIEYWHVVTPLSLIFVFKFRELHLRSAPRPLCLCNIPYFQICIFYG